MKQKRINAFLIFLFIAGLILVFIQPIQNYMIHHIGEDLIQISAEQIEQNDALEADFDFNAAASLSVLDVMNAQINRSDIIVLGSIVIPSVDLQLPIVKGVGKYSLAVGAGTMKADQKMGSGNYALASHYFKDKKDILFSPLYETGVGDIVYVTDKNDIYAYKISKKEVILATDVHVIEDQPGATILTLITCANDGVDRLLVVGTFEGKFSFNELKDELF